MYPEFIAIYVGLAIVIILLVVILIFVIKTKNNLPDYTSKKNYLNASNSSASSGKVAFCKNCATQFDAAAHVCPNCGTPR